MVFAQLLNPALPLWHWRHRSCDSPDTNRDRRRRLLGCDARLVFV